MKNKSLKELQRDVEEMCKERGWDKIPKAERFLLFSEEVGELAKEIRKNENMFGEKSEDSKRKLGEEMADVLSYLLDLANVFKIDLEKAFFDKEETNKRRKWKV